MGQMMPDAKQRAIYVLNVGTIFPKQCLHNGVLTFGVKELVAGRWRRWGATFVSTLPMWFRANSVAFRRSRCGFARIPLRFDAPAVVSCEFRPLLACSGLFWPLLGGSLRLQAATAHAVGRGLRFDTPAVVSREFRCVSMLPLWFRAKPQRERRNAIRAKPQRER